MKQECIIPEALSDFISKENLILFTAENGKVSFSNYAGRHIFYFSERTGKWEYTYTEFPSKKAVQIFKELLKAGLVFEDGRTLIKKAL